MSFKDIALFLHSCWHASPLRPRRYYWDHTTDDQLDNVVQLLSNPNDPERIEIRKALAAYQPLTLLDAGCGPGTELVGYKQQNLQLRYTGLDGSHRMLQLVKQKHPDATFVRGSLDLLPFADGSYDVVLLKHVLEHQPDYQNTVRQAVRVARRAVLINFFHKPLRLPMDIHLKDRRGFWNNWYSRSRFESYVRRLGVQSFEIIRTIGTAGQSAEVYVLKK